jgi:hypothetical protein
MRYEGSNPSLCTIFFVVRVVKWAGFMDMSPDGEGRAAIALGILALIAVAAWLTMEPGKFRSLVWLIVGFNVFRILLVWLRTRYSSNRVIEVVDRESTQAGGWERRRSQRLGRFWVDMKKKR